MLFVDQDDIGCDWVRLVLAEKDVDGAQVRMLRTGVVNEDFLVLNPAHSVPTLADREGVLTGARVIAEYLDERYPHPPLMPQAPSGRARARMALENIEHQLFPLAVAVTPAATRAAQAARVDLFERLHTATRHIGASGYFSGREYTLVDCALAALLHRMQMRGVSVPPESEGVCRYALRLAARSPYRRCFDSKPAAGNN
jgi:RNA polymerase-associated protein